MARKYAIDGIDGLKGGVVTHVDGEIVSPGDELPEGDGLMTITYWYYPTPADIEAGADPNKRISITVEDVPYSASDADVRREIMQTRAMARDENSFGYYTAVFGD
jgi:hypothetical protein